MSKTGSFSNAAKQIVGSCFGIGWSPVAPGTVASAAVLPLAWLSYTTGGAAAVTVLFVATTLACVWSADAVEKAYGKDPQHFVMDEWAGQLLPIAGFAWGFEWGWWTTSPMSIWLLGYAFIGFRVFDIWKPGIIGTIQDKPGVIGLTGDDIIAGLFTLLSGIIVILGVNHVLSMA